MELALGQIIREHGIKGEVKFWLYCLESKIFKSGLRGWLCNSAGERAEVVLEGIKNKDKIFMVKFDKFSTPEQAKIWRGCEFLVETELYEKLPAGEYYLRQLAGFEIVEQTAGVIGKFSGYFEEKSAKWLVIKDLRDQEQLIPWNEKMILQINEAQKKIVVELPEGLIELWNTTS
ncbi:MAG: hypothetical protein ACD_73C00184G0006 [uncultured bacterium]|nr:MAG: hypothetical protein ACD_73C00184G0006 [uncultured bacterium]